VLLAICSCADQRGNPRRHGLSTNTAELQPSVERDPCPSTLEPDGFVFLSERCANEQRAYSPTPELGKHSHRVKNNIGAEAHQMQGSNRAAAAEPYPVLSRREPFRVPACRFVHEGDLATPIDTCTLDSRTLFRNAWHWAHIEVGQLVPLVGTRPKLRELCRASEQKMRRSTPWPSGDPQIRGVASLGAPATVPNLIDGRRVAKASPEALHHEISGRIQCVVPW
jgi:hypothetical protein